MKFTLKLAVSGLFQSKPIQGLLNGQIPEPPLVPIARLHIINRMEANLVHVRFEHLHVFINQCIFGTDRKEQVGKFPLRPLFLSDFPQILIRIKEFFQTASIINDVLHAIIIGVQHRVGIVRAKRTVIHRTGRENGCLME